MRKLSASIRAVLGRDRARPDGVLSEGARLDISRTGRAGALVLLATLGFGGCAQQPQQLAANTGHSKEYFPSSVYGRASRRVIENGPVPHGGGQYLVGKPYTVAGQTYYPSERKLVQIGNASWYGDAFHGRLTANGEIYDRDSFTAAHPTMPLPSYARVTNLRTNASMIVRVNDRGPFASNRVMDVSRRVAEALDFKRTGTAKVKVEYVGRASLAGSDDAKLYATLRDNGPAQWTEGEPTMVAEARPLPRVASAEPMMPAPPPVFKPPVRLEPVAPRREIESEPSTRPRPMVRAEPLPAERTIRDAVRREERPVLVWRRGPVAPDMPRLLARHEGASFARPIQAQGRDEPMPLPRPMVRPGAQPSMARAPVPPARPLDLGTIPGAGVPIGSSHHAASLRMARSSDD